MVRARLKEVPATYVFNLDGDDTKEGMKQRVLFPRRRKDLEIDDGNGINDRITGLLQYL